MTTTARGGRPIKPLRRSIHEAIDALDQALGRQPANVPVWLGRVCRELLQRARDEKAEVYEARDIKERYASLVENYNAVWHAAEDIGIEVFQPMGSDAWHWTRGDARGQAPTPAEALIEALQH